MGKLSKIFGITALLMAVGCTSSLHVSERDPDLLHKHIGASTVALVLLDDEGGSKPYCTGVWINNSEIVTAGHCVAHDEEDANAGESPVGDKLYYVVQPEVSEIRGELAAFHVANVEAFDEEHDLALIKAIRGGIPEHEYASLPGSMPALGERVFIVGHPRGLYWSFAEGTVSAYRAESDFGRAVQVNGTIFFGNSGGGLFDRGGNLVGICSELTHVPQMSLFVHLDSIKRLIKDAHKPIKVEKKEVKKEESKSPDTIPSPIPGITFHLVPAPTPTLVPDPVAPLEPDKELTPSEVPSVVPGLE
jgi:S1-C subfamily serine protease